MLSSTSSRTRDDPNFDLSFWTGLVRERRPRRMLELGCGTGRLTLGLAEAGSAAVRGFELVGLDSSESFLARARERIGERPDVRLELGDIRRPELAGSFDLIAVPFNTLAYLYTPEDRLSTLRAARDLLAPRGVFAFDVLTPRLDFLAEALHPFPPVRQDVDFAVPEAGVSRFLRSCVDRYDPGTQTLTSTFLYEIHRTDGTSERHARDVPWHMYFPDELELLLAAAGLAPVRRHGGWDGEPWKASSGSYVFVCEVA